jgi:hypothetical protein
LVVIQGLYGWMQVTWRRVTFSTKLRNVGAETTGICRIKTDFEFFVSIQLLKEMRACACVCVCVKWKKKCGWRDGWDIWRRRDDFFRKGGVPECGAVLFLWLLSLQWSLICPIEQQIFRPLFPSAMRSGNRGLFCWITYPRFRYYQAAACCCILKVTGVTSCFIVVSGVRNASGCLELIYFKYDAINIQYKYWNVCENVCRTVSGCLLTDRNLRY